MNRESCPTVKVYKGSKSVIVNVEDVDVWRDGGWETSNDRVKKAKASKEAKVEKESKDEKE